MKVINLEVFFFIRKKFFVSKLLNLNNEWIMECICIRCRMLLKFAFLIISLLVLFLLLNSAKSMQICYFHCRKGVLTRYQFPFGESNNIIKWYSYKTSTYKHPHINKNPTKIKLLLFLSLVFLYSIIKLV